MNKEWNEEQRIKDFLERIQPVFTEDIIDYMISGGFFTGPSSTGAHGTHGVFPGGNFWHSRMVGMLLREYTDKMGLQWERPESPQVIGWLHDLCKMDEYIWIDGSSTQAGHYEHKKNIILSGHGDKSAILALSKMHLTDEEIMCIRWHMGAFEGKDKWDSYTAAVKKYPNILWTHQADMVASQVMNI